MEEKPHSEMYLEAVRLNNRGVSLIEAGRYDDAKLKLQLAIKTTQALAQALQSDPNVVPRPPKNIRYRWGQHAPLTCSETKYFIFRRALSIVPLSSEDLGISTCRAESTAMLFNLGLSFHLAGTHYMKTNRVYSLFLLRALECYRVAFSMRQKHHTDASGKKLAREALFDLGLSCNLGDIHCHFMDYDEAAKCFGRISETLGQNRDSLSSEDVTVFCLNLASFSMPRMAGAA
jgi:tetratricopeptide (TPR) repeat protein